MSKKDVNEFGEGVKYGLKLNKELVQKELSALNYLKKLITDVGHDVDGMSDAIDSLIDNFNDEAVERLFGITHPYGLEHLEDHEKRMLLNALTRLSLDGKNANQTEYCTNIKSALGLLSWQPDAEYDFSSFERIELVENSKVLYKALRIFFFLYEDVDDKLDNYDKVLFSRFNLNDSIKDTIDAEIRLIEFVFCEEGLVRYYGISDDYEKFDVDFSCEEEDEYKAISYECAQGYAKKILDPHSLTSDYIESNECLAYINGDDFCCVDKETGELHLIPYELRFPIKCFCIWGRTVYYISKNVLYCYKFNDEESMMVCSRDEFHNINYMCVYRGKKLFFREAMKSTCHILNLKGLEMKSFVVEEIKKDSQLLGCYEGYLYFGHETVKNDLVTFHQKVFRFSLDSLDTSEYSTEFLKSKFKKNRWIVNLVGAINHRNHLWILFDRIKNDDRLNKPKHVLSYFDLDSGENFNNESKEIDIPDDYESLSAYYPYIAYSKKGALYVYDQETECTKRVFKRNYVDGAGLTIGERAYAFSHGLIGQALTRIEKETENYILIGEHLFYRETDEIKPYKLDRNEIKKESYDESKRSGNRDS